MAFRREAAGGGLNHRRGSRRSGGFTLIELLIKKPPHTVIRFAE